MEPLPHGMNGPAEGVPLEHEAGSPGDQAVFGIYDTGQYGKPEDVRPDPLMGQTVQRPPVEVGGPALIHGHGRDVVQVFLENGVVIEGISFEVSF